VIEHMRAKLLRAVEAGEAEEQHVRPVLLAFDRPGMVWLEPGRNRHQAALIDLITTATAAIGATHVVSVRRLQAPLLTGSEPVILFRDPDIVGGVSCAKLLSEPDPPVAFWEQRADMLTRVNEILAATAGLSWAADRHTVVLMSNPETADGTRLTYLFNELPGNALAGILNLKVKAASDWVAGAAGDELRDPRQECRERGQRKSQTAPARGERGCAEGGRAPTSNVLQTAPTGTGCLRKFPTASPLRPKSRSPI
jgi:hypothetical protein